MLIFYFSVILITGGFFYFIMIFTKGKSDILSNRMFGSTIRLIKHKWGRMKGPNKKCEHKLQGNKTKRDS